MMAALGLAACSGGAETDAPTSTLGMPVCDTTDTVDDPSALNGVYQLDWSYEDLAEATGLTGYLIEINDGLFTLTLSDGCFNLGWEDPGFCAGAYTVTGDRISMVSTIRIADWGCGRDLLGREFVNAAWELNEDQLTMSDFVQPEGVDDEINTLLEGFYGTKPLLRVEGTE